MKTAFVTGGTGFLGLNLVELLRQRDWKVVAIHRPASSTKRLAGFGATLLAIGLEDPKALAAAMPEKVDAVFHVAGDLSMWKLNDDRQRRVNVDGTRNVVAAALERRAQRFIHTSSVAAYGLNHAVVNERTPSTAETSRLGYVRTKWSAEQEVRKGIARGLPAVILNPGNIVGPYDTTGWARMFRLLKDNKVPGVPPGSASFCHVRDVAHAHLEAVTSGRVGENYLLGGADATHAEFAGMVAEHVGAKPPRPVPAFVLRTLGQINEWVSYVTRKEPDVTPEAAELLSSRWRIDSSKAAQELGFRLGSLREMTKDSYDWLVSEKLL